ncbi:MAG: hypothetical protein Q9175_000096 [Cornicularia normoerica]
MKFTSIIFTTLLAMTSVEAAAIANPAPEAQSYHGYCYRPGEPCAKLKRAAEAAAEAIADPQSYHGYCYRIGEPCSKAKRDALALAEATAEALAAADPEAHPCHAPGAPCSKAKREALDAFMTAPSPPKTSKLANIPRAPHYGSTHGYCWLEGEPCSKLKRAAEAVAEAIAQPNQDLEAGKQTYLRNILP